MKKIIKEQSTRFILQTRKYNKQIPFGGQGGADIPKLSSKERLFNYFRTYGKPSVHIVCIGGIGFYIGTCEFFKNKIQKTLKEKTAILNESLREIDTFKLKSIFKELVIEIGPNHFVDLSKIIEGGKKQKYKLRVIDIILTRTGYRKEKPEARIINTIIFTQLLNLEHGLMLLMDINPKYYDRTFYKAKIGLNYFAWYIFSCQKEYKAGRITKDPSENIFRRFDMKVFKDAFDLIYKEELKGQNSYEEHIRTTYQKINTYLETNNPKLKSK